MKKLAILGASAALAALPVVGVFAAEAGSHTDEVKVTVAEACSLSQTSEGVGTAVTIANGGNNKNIPGSVFTIKCNDSKGWDLNAIGGESESPSTQLTGTVGKAIDTGTTLDGSVSDWAFQVTGTGTVEAYNNFNKVPGESTKVASNTGTTASATITAKYAVGISADQAADTYTGKVTYTLIHPAVTD